LVIIFRVLSLKTGLPRFARNDGVDSFNAKNLNAVIARYNPEKLNYETKSKIHHEQLW
jgi:hypothetical protein